MSLAVLKQKNSINTWWRAQNRQSKRLKKSRPGGKQEKNDFDLVDFFKILTKGMAKAILIATCLYSVFSSYRFITSSPYFNINQINWSGHQRLSTEELISWVGPLTGKNIFQLDLNEVSQKIAQHPWIKTASARRVFPQKLDIKLNERIPYARVQLDKVYIMDNYGVLLGPEQEKFSKLPLITGISSKGKQPGNNVVNAEIVNGLKTMHYINLLPIFKKNPIDTVRVSDRAKVTFITQKKDTKVYMRPKMAQESFKNLMLVMDIIGEDKRDLSYIDLSFKNKVVVKHNDKNQKEFSKN